MTLADDVTALQARLVSVRRERDRAQGAYDSARQVADAARADLAQEFGVHTIEDAEALLRQLQDRLTDEVDQLTRMLDEIGA